MKRKQDTQSLATYLKPEASRGFFTPMSWSPEDLLNEARQFDGPTESLNNLDEAMEFLKLQDPNELLEVRVHAGPFSPIATFRGKSSELLSQLGNITPELFLRGLYTRDVHRVDVTGKE